MCQFQADTSGIGFLHDGVAVASELNGAGAAVISGITQAQDVERTNRQVGRARKWYRTRCNVRFWRDGQGGRPELIVAKVKADGASGAELGAAHKFHASVGRDHEVGIHLQHFRIAIPDTCGRIVDGGGAAETYARLAQRIAAARVDVDLGVGVATETLIAAGNPACRNADQHAFVAFKVAGAAAQRGGIRRGQATAQTEHHSSWQGFACGGDGDAVRCIARRGDRHLGQGKEFNGRTQDGHLIPNLHGCTTVIGRCRIGVHVHTLGCQRVRIGIRIGCLDGETGGSDVGDDVPRGTHGLGRQR